MNESQLTQGSLFLLRFFSFIIAKLSLTLPISFQYKHKPKYLLTAALLCLVPLLVITMRKDNLHRKLLGPDRLLIPRHSLQKQAPHARQMRNPSDVFPSEDNFTKYQLNTTISDNLPLDRRIPDTRPEDCKGILYNLDDLPTASVVIPFHNEAWSVLLRTIVTILGRSPRQLLKEVIIVDDASDYEYLKAPLKDYLDGMKDARIKLIRKDKREGLIKARMQGAREATAEVLIFLDAHVEVNVQWLEPLLEAIKHDHRKIAVPNIDDITPETMDYIRWMYFREGGFKWTLDYEWKRINPETSEEVLKAAASSAKPFRTATTIGCALAINRKYFFEIGAYDEGMLIWGGENLEISFRNWMCGGSIYVLPCSRVGHIFRRFLPYTFPDLYGSAGVINRNLQRAAEVWMGDYKRYYYASTKVRARFNDSEMASLNLRKAVRRRLKCKSFAWYLRNVLPDMPLPKGEPSYHGQIKSAIMKQCLRKMTGDESGFEAKSCYSYDKNSCFSLSADQAIVLQNGDCMTHDEPGTGLTYENCKTAKTKGEWVFDTSNVERFKTNFPIDQVEDLPLGQIVFKNLWGTACLAFSQDVSQPYFMDCNPESIRQFWYFTYHFNYDFAQDDQ